MPEIPGSSIVAYCKKCEADTPHTVLEVVEKGKRLGKVRCDTCREEHPFRRPKKAVKKPATRPARPRRSSKSKTPAEIPVQEAWRQVEAMVEAATKIPYEMARAFEKGEVLDHPQFGTGVVVTVLSPTKVEVLFPDARRKLVCGKTTH